MIKQDEVKKPVDNMELLKEQASSCGSDCACHAAEPSGRMRWVVGLVILVAAFALAARAVVKNKEASRDKASAGFATLTVPGQAPAVDSSVVQSNSVAVRDLEAIADLNTVAKDIAGAFIFLSSKTDATDKEAMTQIVATTKVLERQVSGKIGVFALKTGSPDYQKATAQMTLPGVLVMVKGGGIAPVSGDIDEFSLVQAFVAASGCGPSGCGPGGCK